jgi:hypothetical protein
MFTDLHLRELSLPHTHALYVFSNKVTHKKEFFFLEAPFYFISNKIDCYLPMRIFYSIVVTRAMQKEEERSSIIM